MRDNEKYRGKVIKIEYTARIDNKGFRGLGKSAFPKPLNP
jgi:hypothetical protein